MTTEQLSLLNAFLYYDAVVFEDDNSLGDNIESMRREKPLEWEEMMQGNPGAIGREKAEKVVEAILADEKLYQLRVVNCTRIEPYYDGPINLCLADDKNKEVLFVFRGTNGREWMDNAEGFLQESSPLQRETLAYFNKVVQSNRFLEKGYVIDVTGHSKGGNKAQYITIKSPHVRACYSFHGQGFSEEFQTENKEAIKERGRKIKSYAADRDYVNVLGNSIAGERKYFKTNRPLKKLFSITRIKVVNTVIAHSAGAYINFDKDGKVRMNPEVEASGFAKEVNRMSLKMMKEPKAEKAVYFTSVMGVVQMMHTADPIYERKMPKLPEIKRGIDKTIEFAEANGMKHILLQMAKSRGAAKLYHHMVKQRGVLDRMGPDQETESLQREEGHLSVKEKEEGRMSLNEWKQAIGKNATVEKMPGMQREMKMEINVPER